MAEARIQSTIEKVIHLFVVEEHPRLGINLDNTREHQDSSCLLEHENISTKFQSPVQDQHHVIRHAMHKFRNMRNTFTKMEMTTSFHHLKIRLRDKNDKIEKKTVLTCSTPPASVVREPIKH